jgi:hypothetical protein
MQIHSYLCRYVQIRTDTSKKTKIPFNFLNTREASQFTPVGIEPLPSQNFEAILPLHHCRAPTSYQSCLVLNMFVIYTYAKHWNRMCSIEDCTFHTMYVYASIYTYMHVYVCICMYMYVYVRSILVQPLVEKDQLEQRGWLEQALRWPPASPPVSVQPGHWVMGTAAAGYDHALRALRPRQRRAGRFKFTRESASHAT